MYDMQYLSNALGDAGLGTKYDRGALEGIDQLVYTQKATAGFRRKAKAALHNEFSLWLQGKHIDNTEMNAYDDTRNGVVERRHFMDGEVGPKDNWKPTWWGNSQLTHLPGVRQYLIDSKMASEHDTMDLNQLAEFGPQNLDDAWAYFKTWVKGMPVSEAVNFNHSTMNDFDRSLFGPKMPSQMMENNPMDDAASMEYADPDTEPTKPDTYSEFKPYTGEGKSYKPTAGTSKPSTYKTDEAKRNIEHELQQTREQARRAQLKRDADNQASKEAADYESAREKARRDAVTKARNDADDEDKVATDASIARETVRQAKAATARVNIEKRQMQAEAAAVEKETADYEASLQRQQILDADNKAKATAAEDARQAQADEHARLVESQKNQLVLQQQAEEKSILNARVNAAEYNRLLTKSRDDAEVQQGKLALAAVTESNRLHIAATAVQATIQLDVLKAFLQYRVQADERAFEQAQRQASANNAEFDRIKAMTLEFQQGERDFQSTLASTAYLNMMREIYKKMVLYYAGEYVRQRDKMATGMKMLKDQWENTNDPMARETLMIKMKEQDQSNNVILLGYREKAQIDTKKRLQDFSTQQDTTLTIYKQEKAAVAASNTELLKIQRVLDGQSQMDTGDGAQSKPSNEEIAFIMNEKVNDYIRKVSDLIDSGTLSGEIQLDGSTSVSTVKEKYEGDLDLQLYYNDLITDKIIAVIESSNAPDRKKAAMIQKLRDAQTKYTNSINLKRKRLALEVSKEVSRMVQSKDTRRIKKKGGKLNVI